MTTIAPALGILDLRQAPEFDTDIFAAAGDLPTHGAAARAEGAGSIMVEPDAAALRSHFRAHEIN